jgi:hypothetical protein
LNALNGLLLSDIEVGYVEPPPCFLRHGRVPAGMGCDKDADAYHIYSAECARLDYFLTLDKKLIKSVRHQRRLIFSVDVVLPSELVAKMR